MNTWLTLDQARDFLACGEGAGIRIAVLDSGIDVTHPDLQQLQLRDALAVVEDGLHLKVMEDQHADVFGHGTAIAGIIHRLAPAAELGSIRVLGEHLRSRTAIIREGVRQALDRGYHILNCSFGCGREDHVLQYKDWIDDAYLRGRHVVAACNNVNYHKREWPGHFPTVITVNFVPEPDADAMYFRSGTLVEFGARGHQIEVPWIGGGFKTVTGSSFAAPHVAGMLARLLSCCPQMGPLEAKALMQRLARPWPG